MGNPPLVARNRLPSISFDPNKPKPDEQKELLRQMKFLLKNPIIQGKLIDSWKDPMTGAADTFSFTEDQHSHVDCIHLAAGVPKEIPHMLGRAPLGYIPVRVISGSVDLVENYDADRTNVITLESSTEAYIHLWVF